MKTETEVYRLLRSYLSDFCIDLVGVLPLRECHIRKPYLLEAAAFTAEHTYVTIFAIPYYSHAADHAPRNLSAYATVRDYHVFTKQLFDTLLPRLRADFPHHTFVGFSDHSPIDEIDAAVKAGLGVLGKNALLLTERYSSYVFLAEIVTDLPLTPTPSPLPSELRVCHNCGLCRRACPMGADELCRSALTQKKSPLSENELQTLAAFPSVWGCDICQEVCPYTARARHLGTIYSPIPFFRESTLPYLTLDALDAMSDEEFSMRAYAWRGRKTIRRNLLLHESAPLNDNEKEDTPCST